MSSLYVSFTSVSKRDTLLVNRFKGLLKAEGHVVLNERRPKPGETLDELRDAVFREMDAVVIVLSGAYLRSRLEVLKRLLSLRSVDSTILVVRRGGAEVPQELADCPVLDCGENELETRVLAALAPTPEPCDPPLKSDATSLSPLASQPSAQEHGKIDIKIFLASSGELRDERQEVRNLIQAQNRKLRKENIFIDLFLWEDYKKGFHQNRAQDHFNEKLLECDVVVCMFFKKFGKYTKEEYDLAYRHFKEERDGGPRHLWVFFKSGKVDIESVDEDVLRLKRLKQEIEDAGQMYIPFKSLPHLSQELGKQLEFVIEESRNRAAVS